MLGGRSRRSLGSGATAVRITAILTAVGCCLAAAAYATTRSADPGPGPGGEGSRPLRPRITVHPESVTTEATAEFDLSQPGRPAGRARPGPPLRFECRLDEEPWQPCFPPVTLNGIGRGGHRFAVRAVNRAGNAGPAADFTWRRTRAKAPAAAPTPTPEVPSNRPASPPTGPPAYVPPAEPPPVEEPETPPTGLPFTIEQVGTLEELLPGAPAQTIGVRIDNPNPSPITVTSLTAAVANDPPGCPATENFVLSPAAVSPSAPVVVAAESTLSLPEAGIAGPTIAMVNLPTSQDACQAAELEISLSGEASG